VAPVVAISQASGWFQPKIFPEIKESYTVTVPESVLRQHPRIMDFNIFNAIKRMKLPTDLKSRITMFIHSEMVILGIGPTRRDAVSVPQGFSCVWKDTPFRVISRQRRKFFGASIIVFSTEMVCVPSQLWNHFQTACNPSMWCSLHWGCFADVAEWFSKAVFQRKFPPSAKVES